MANLPPDSDLAKLVSISSTSEEVQSTGPEAVNINLRRFPLVQLPKKFKDVALVWTTQGETLFPLVQLPKKFKEACQGSHHPRVWRFH